MRSDNMKLGSMRLIGEEHARLSLSVDWAKDIEPRFPDKHEFLLCTLQKRVSSKFESF
jgi:hypothetical protein